MKDALLPCIACGKTMTAALDEELQPNEGTTFRSYGHYGSTFWDSFHGEQIIVIVCDDCLRAHTERIARHKRFRNLDVVEDQYGAHFQVGIEWLEREPVPWFDGPDDNDDYAVDIEDPDELAYLRRHKCVELNEDNVAYWLEHHAEEVP